MSIVFTLAAELVVAKTVDATVAGAARQRGSPAEAFFAQMAREGLRAGWDKTGAMLPWWYGALSSGASGATDFVAGSVIAGLLRKQFDRVLEEHPALKGVVGAPSFDQVLLALKGEGIPSLPEPAARALQTVVDAMVQGDGDGALLKRLLAGAPDVELRSPITRHLKKALGDPEDSAFAGFVKRNLISKRHADADPLGGTVVGHAIAGAATGLLTGHPELGVLVTLGDSVSEGLLAKKAMEGDYRALASIKAALLLKGVRETEAPPDWRGRLNNRLLGWYSQMGGEVRLLGQDLANLVAASDHVAQRALPAALSTVVEGAAHVAAFATARAHGEPPSTTSASTSAPTSSSSSTPAAGVERGYAQRVVSGAAAALVSEGVPAAVGAGGRSVGARAGASLHGLLRDHVREARRTLEHHGEVGIGALLAEDFATERAALAEARAQLQEAAATRLTRLKTEYPHLTQALQHPQAQTPTLSGWWQKARSIASHGLDAGVQAVRASTQAAAAVAAAAKETALGQTILRVADDVVQAFRVEAVMAKDAVVDSARQGSFAAIRHGGGALAQLLLAAERAVQRDPERVNEALASVEALRDQAGVALLDALRQLHGAGATGVAALGVVLEGMLGALDRGAAHLQRSRAAAP